MRIAPGFRPQLWRWDGPLIFFQGRRANQWRFRLAFGSGRAFQLQARGQQFRTLLCGQLAALAQFVQALHTQFLHLKPDGNVPLLHFRDALRRVERHADVVPIVDVHETSRRIEPDTAGIPPCRTGSRVPYDMIFLPVKRRGWRE
jgi:hypothetical protein